MVHLKSMPFQWRKAPRTCTCHAKKCFCRNKQSATRLFVSLPKLSEKLFIKKNAERFRNKVKVSFSMVPKISNSMFGSRRESPFMCESSICLTKRTSLYRSFSPGWSQDSDVTNTDLLFENMKYDSELEQDSCHDIRPIFSNESTKLSAVLEKDIVVSCSSNSKEPILSSSKCNVYDDLQRKWDHVKNFAASQGTRNPLSMLKNFCSSLFKLTCDKDTCPKLNKKDKDGKQKNKGPKDLSSPSFKENSRDGNQSNKAPKESAIRIESSKSVKENDRYGKQNNEAPKETESTEKELEDAKPKNTTDVYTTDVFTSVNKQILTDAIVNVDVGIQSPETRHKETQRTAIEVMDTITSALGAQDKEIEKVQSNGNLEMATSPFESLNYLNFCNRQVQYDLQDARDSLKNKKKVKFNKAIGSFVCLCDESVQFSRHAFCTCATQHFSGINLANRRHKPVAVNETSHVSCKKTQYKDTPEAAHKATHCIARKVKTDYKNAVQSSNEEQVTFSESSTSSASLRSDGSKTDTTICSLATMNYNDTPQRRRFKVKVLTKANQSTLTDKTPVCDTGMVTDDWWSPIVERRGNDTIRLEKKKGFNIIERQKKELRELNGLRELQELKGLKELREIRKRRKNFGMMTDGRNVTFRSTTQIIPPALVGMDVMSPARYLLESQKYYNELYAFNYRLPPQMVYNYVTQMPKSYDKEKNRSSIGSRRNHQRKTKRLDECYSPRRQREDKRQATSPRKRQTESTKSPDSSRRKHRQDRQSNNRHTKNYSPRKKV